MGFNEVFGRALSILAEVRVGTLCTIDEKGYPRSRWMTPTTLDGSGGLIYAVTSGSLAKAKQMRGNPKVEWGFQSRDLVHVARLQGVAKLSSDALLAAEVLESIGPNLGVFWRIAGDPRELIVIETRVEKVWLFNSISLERVEAEQRNGE